MEICVDSIESVKNAIAGGATRLEVCSSLSEGGLTPTPGLVRFIKEYNDSIKIYVMIRIRSGNFVYNRDEMNAMLHDVKILADHDVDGYVFGALRPDGSIDSDFCREIIDAAKPRPVTFHRAFDEAISPLETLETIIDLGFERILTSGQKDRALEGVELIKRLVDRAADRIVIMPGSGVNPTNIQALRFQTGAKEFHASAKVRMDLGAGANNVKIGDTDDSNGRYVMVTSEKIVRQMVNILKNT